jgi:hypothetical protein
MPFGQSAAERYLALPLVHRSRAEAHKPCRFDDVILMSS